MKLLARGGFLAVVVFISLPARLLGDYPRIYYTLPAKDPLYRQHQDDVEVWYQENRDPPPLAIYQYTPLPSENLFTIAAAFNLPYETLATLNGWDDPRLLQEGEPLLVPNAPGLFLPVTPVGDWEQQMAKEDRRAALGPLSIKTAGGGARDFSFFPGTRFTPEERGRFLGALFIHPLRGGVITSRFGYRPHPVTGEWHFHSGADIRAAVGQAVYASRGGVVSETGYIETLGNFIILDHQGGYQTVYAHLDQILTTQNQRVEAGELIGRAGNSGISTGPHLHFEVRRDGKPANPLNLANLESTP